MKIIKETSLKNFEAWQGGKDTMNNLSHSDMERLEQHIEELYPEGCTDVELNDFLWFERDMIADLLGYRDYEALVNYDIRDWKEYAKSVLFEHFPNADEDLVDDYIESEFTEEASDEEVIDEFKMYMKYCAEEDDENED